MELILENELEHQQKAIDAVGDLFDGVKIGSPALYYNNPTIDVLDRKLAPNIKDIQNRLKVHLSMRGATVTDECINVDVKMETGTGKTYVYTKTIYELHKRYGINKFIVAVPSLPIKAGTQQFISDPYVQKHFKDVCGYDTNIDLCVVNTTKIKKGKRFFPSSVRAFVDGSCHNKNKIYVLLVNMSLLTTGKQLSRNDYDYGVQGFDRPFNAIAATKPFVIIDEPHRFSRDQKAYKIILEELKPQCVIRYGATFPSTTSGRGRNKVTVKDYQNLLYDLDACDSFNLGLIKGVAKEHFEPESAKEEKVKIVSIESKTSVSFNHKAQASSKSHILRVGDSLSIISDELSGLSISAIGNGFIELSNGQTKYTGEEFTVDIYSTSYQEQMVKLAIHRHFETEKENFNRQSKIKTLALFFIDNIESYRGDGAWLKDIFERLLIERINIELDSKDINPLYKEYLEASLSDITACSAGYFAQDNNDSDENIEQEVDEILHNKKKLLSFRRDDGSWNTRRFLFSKWTLKEGWDNPNVFTITKLRSSGSENSKLQEVGRGLRLPVDEYGNRISNEEFMLNYIVDFTEKRFAEELVAQINGERPTATVSAISQEELSRVATLRGQDDMAFMMELYNKKYIIDVNRTLDQTRLLEFYAEYPEFSSNGVGGSNIIDRNSKNNSNKVKIRKAQYDELKELWEAINQKYILFYNKDVDTLIDNELPNLLADDIFYHQTLTSTREVVTSNDKGLDVSAGVGVSYIIEGRKLPYNQFLKRINKSTNIPITSLHKAMCEYAKYNNIDSSLINEGSLSRFISKFMDWKITNLQGRFNYKQTQYKPQATALTNADGSLRADIVQGNIGVHIERGVVSEKYLYDAMAYDSPLELKNIKTDMPEIVVYGKIPRRSVSIPTITGESYSPDFMYIVRKANGEKELNIVIETKDVEGKSTLRPVEQAKISCAEVFYKQLKLDGYTVHFRTQLNNKQMANIIHDLTK